MNHEYAQTADDIVWRRSKLGLRMSEDQIGELDSWMTAKLAGSSQATSGVRAVATGGR